MPSAAAAAPAAGAARIRAVRRWWHTAHEPPSLLKRLEPAYYVAITSIVVVPFVYGTASSALADVLTPHAVGVWGPSFALVAILALARWGAIQGPVIFSVADVAHLLGAPLPRAKLVTRRLVRGIGYGAAGTALAGATALVGVAGNGRGIDPERGAGFVVAALALGTLGMAGASLVQGSKRWDRATRRATWPLIGAAAGLVALGSSGAAALHAALWIGPWGWAVEPLAGGRAWPVAVALLLVLSGAAVAFAFARRGASSTERHLLRAEARDGAVAAMYSLNARYIARSLAGVGAGPTTGRGVRLRAPRSPRLGIVWRDATAALSTPQRLAEAAALAGGGTLVCLVGGAHPAAVAGGVLAIYAGGSRLLEPLRAETDKPTRARVLLPVSMGRVLRDHAVVPAVVVLAAAALATAGCAVAGALPPHGAAAALLVLAATPAITLCAALSSRRGGQLPDSLMAMTYSDQTGSSVALVLGWIALWPALGVALGTVPVSLVVAHGPQALAQLVALLLAASCGLTVGLSWERLAP
jgi:hypothetical protein